MRPLLPQYIVERFEASESSGTFSATAMFADISGFTALTESLMRVGAHGAELLCDLLESIFGPVLRAVHARGGFVTTFAGDAFTALFQGDDAASVERATSAAVEIQKFFREHSKVQTPFGEATIAVKIGLARGAVRWVLLAGTPSRVYGFRGEAVDACAAAEHHAERGDIIGHPSLEGLLPKWVEFSEREHHFLLKPIAQDSVATNGAAPPAIPTSVLSSFGFGDVNANARAEFREIASAFVSFEAPANDEALNTYVSTVVRLAATYGGHFNKLDFGDKGAVLLLLFGAPVARENDLKHAGEFALALLREVGATPTRVGLTTGRVYAGLVGAEERGEYTAIGDIVNLSARLMMAAPYGQIWCSQPFAERLDRNFRFEAQGARSFKGKSGQIPVFRLMAERSEESTDVYKAPMVGRVAERAALRKALSPLGEGRAAGVVCIYGEPGMGKSRLAYAVHEQAEDELNAAWAVCPADEMLKRPLGPFRHWLRSLFGQTPELATEERLRVFHERFDALLAGLPSRAEHVRAELTRTRSVLAALLDLHWDGSLYEQLDGRGRKENTALAVENLLRALTFRRPIVLNAEDAQWYDTDSAQLLDTLLRVLSNVPFAVLLSSRYRDDGARPELPFDASYVREVVELKQLAREDIAALATRLLSLAPSSELVDFLKERAAGNPFFVEQLVLDLGERGLIVRGETAGLAGAAAGEVPATVGAVLVARLDRLVAEVKRVVQTAAVLGSEFDLRVLNEMLRQEGFSSSNVRAAEREQIWSSMDAVHLSFRHALLRDAAYRMQLRARLRDLHRLAGEALERLHPEDAAPVAQDLAFHFEQAERFGLAAKYLGVAAEWALGQGQMRAGEALAGKALQFLDRVEEKERQVLQPWVLYLRGALREGEGRNEDACADLQAALSIPNASRAQQVRALVTLGRVRWRMDQVADAQQTLEEALSLAKEQGDEPSRSEVLRQLGNVYWRQGHLDRAKANFEESLRLDRALGRRVGVTTNLMNLGNIAYYTSQYDQAVVLMKEALSEGQACGYRWGIAATENNLGFAALSMDALEDASRAFRASMRMSVAIGAAPIALEAMTGLAAVYAKREQWKRAAVLIGRAVSHPATDVEVEDKAKPVKEQIAAKLSAEALEAAMAEGAQQELEALVEAEAM